MSVLRRERQYRTSLGILSLILIVVGAEARVAYAQTTPLPSNPKIVAPEGSVPLEVAAFSGKWTGMWEGKLNSTLVVRKIHAANGKGGYKAEGIYSWGAYPSWGITRADYKEWEGEIKDGRLEFQMGQADLRYTFSKEPNALDGFYVRRAQPATMGTFTRVKE